eukprot:TRINITY_DN5799_c1_g2_i1.p1 TRINITY_DN5799_c1_g2~~TRINITY_DN5799_c1_g2_i1.p1  ORF type:complete len:480 (+),score=157.16 TRINITY_DN5799_c1_g2_i1:1297-2736(+)
MVTWSVDARAAKLLVQKYARQPAAQKQRVGKDVQWILARLVAERAPIGLRTFTAAIKVLGDIDDHRGAHRAFQKMEECGVAPDGACYDAMLRATQRAPALFSAVGDMKRQAGHAVTAQELQAVLSMLWAQKRRQMLAARFGAGDADAAAVAKTEAAAEQVAASAAAHRVPLDLQHYTLLLRCSASTARCERWFQAMAAAQFVPGGAQFLAAMEVAAEEGAADAAARYLHTLSDTVGDSPTLRHYTALARAHRVAGALREADAVFRACDARFPDGPEGYLHDACVERLMTLAALQPGEVGGRVTSQAERVFARCKAPSAGAYYALLLVLRAWRDAPGAKAAALRLDERRCLANIRAAEGWEDLLAEVVQRAAPGAARSAGGGGVAASLTPAPGGPPARCRAEYFAEPPTRDGGAEGWSLAGEWEDGGADARSAGAPPPPDEVEAFAIPPAPPLPPVHEERLPAPQDDPLYAALAGIDGGS